MELLHQSNIQHEAERPLHGDDVFVRDLGRLAGGNALRRGQHAGVEPGRVEGRKSRKLLGTGGQQHIAALPGKVFCGLCRRLKHGAALGQGTLGPQQA